MSANGSGMDALAAKWAAVQLAEHLNQAGWLCRHLKPPLGDAAALELACLEEAIALREAGQAQLSLALLDQSEALGLQSGWLHDNRARALVELGERQQAAAIWATLQQANDAALRDTAAAMQAEQERCLVEACEEASRRWGWWLRHLREEEPALEQRLLLELIASREAGQPQLSLELAETAEELGWGGPWVSDNKARALVELGREAEAVQLWQNVLKSSDPSLVELAEAMLNTYQARAEAQEEERLLRESERNPESRATLEALVMKRLRQNPSDLERIQRLGRLQEAAQDRGDALLDAETRHHRQVLAGLKRLSAELIP